MAKINLDKEKVWKITKKAGEFAIYGVATVLSYVSVKDTVDVVRYSGNVNYSDAIGLIMDSSMYSSDKHKLITLLPKDKDSDFYKAIIKVIKSNMYSSDKIKTIETMIEK